MENKEYKGPEILSAQVNAIRQAEKEWQAAGLDIKDPRFQQGVNNQLNQICKSYGLDLNHPLRLDY